MGIKAIISKPYARFARKRIGLTGDQAIVAQEKVLQELLAVGRTTLFGRDHQLNKVGNYEAFRQAVPLRDYEGLKSYIQRIKEGELDVLWKGAPLYLSKTSGTTSGTKYIPISKESIRNQLNAARNALLCYISETNNAHFLDGKMMFLQGSPELEKMGKLSIGRLSGIVAHHVPAYLLKNRMPSWENNCIDDWEAKVDAIVEETAQQDMRLISGIPPWVQMYFERLLEKTGKSTVREVFPNLSVFAHGGVNYAPYQGIMEKLIGGPIDTIETYPSSEGFIAFQDSQQEPGLLLVVNDGIFFEFIPMSELDKETPTRLTLKDVELGVNYAIVLNTNAGLWGYQIGDTVKFVSLDPFRIVVTGRTKHFISAFGEHVIAEEVESSLLEAISSTNAEIVEFHVAPQVNPTEGELPFHEWFIEFSNLPDDWSTFCTTLDQLLQSKNSYYKDLITGNVLQPLQVTPVAKDGFVDLMKSQGKLGGQNKAPRLANDRSFADGLAPFFGN